MQEKIGFICFLVLYVLAIALGVSKTIYVIISEITPLYLLHQVKATCATFGFFTTFLVTTFFLNGLEDPQGKWIIFLILAANSVLFIIFVYFFVPESSGKSVRANLINFIGEDKLNKSANELKTLYDIRLFKDDLAGKGDDE